jgi:hypothetical protein
MTWWMIALIFHNGNLKARIVHAHPSRYECVMDGDEQTSFYAKLRGTVSYYCVAEKMPEIFPK